MSKVQREQIWQRHDLGLKGFFGLNSIFLELMQNFVDRKWASSIDEITVTKVEKSFVRKDYVAREADMLYLFKMKEREVLVYVLLELQSTVDYMMPFRLLEYMLLIWQDVFDNTPEKVRKCKSFRLPPIIPVVVHNGEKKWTAARNFKEIIDDYEAYGDALVDFKYILIDVHRYSKGDLLKVAGKLSHIFLLDQCTEYDEFEEALQHAIMEFGKPDTDPQVCKLWKTWFSKIVSVFLDEEEQKKVMQGFDQLSLEEVNDMRSNFVYSIDRLIKNGRKQGRAEGREEGRAKGWEEGREEGWEEGREEGWEEGREEGRVEGIFEVIENLLKMGMSEIVISNATRVPVDEIRRFSQNRTV